MKVLNIVKNIILDIVIVILLIIIAIGFLNKNKPISVFGYYFFTVKTGSMQNTLKVGDSIIVKEMDDYQVGDIITYKMEDVYVTHRIIKIDGDQITTKGDANKDSDPPFSKKNILGKFIYKSEWLNFLVFNRIPIILIVIILCLIGEVLKPSKKKVVKDAS